MKKLCKFLFTILCITLCLFTVNTATNNYSRAQESLLDTQFVDVQNDTLANLSNFVSVGMYNRTPGSNGEQLVASFIQQSLTSYGLQGKSNATTVNGLQKFEFKNKTDEKLTSYNIAFTLKGKSSDKKVVICTNYDNMYYSYYSEEDYNNVKISQGVNASASSVAVLLTMAQKIPQNYFNFDIEFVFFGARNANNSGAKFYNKNINQTERESILLLVDISRIALGNNVYYYSGAFKTKQDQLYNKTLTAKKYNSGFSGASSFGEDTKLRYYNAGYNGNTTAFEGYGLNVLHLFAGDYSGGLFGGYREYSEGINVTDTYYDNIEYILQNYGNDLQNNMALAVTNIVTLLEDNEFITSMQLKNNNNWKYKMFSNTGYLGAVIIVVIFILAIITILYHYKLTKKCYSYIEKNKISGAVLEIEEQDIPKDNTDSLKK